jgi:hypothetical protein
MADMLKQRSVSPVELGLDTIAASLTADLAIHNRIMADVMTIYGSPTAERRRRYGVAGQLEFLKADEFTRSHTQKVITGSEVEFPMDGFQAAIGWTAMFFKNKSVADLAQTQVAAKIGHSLAVRRELQRAIYGATNYTVADYRVDSVNLDIKRFLNADGAIIPLGPNGEVFNPATHTHYIFSDGLTNVSAHALVDTVVEHHQDGTPVVFISSADEAAWRLLADFKPFVDSRLTLPITTSTPTTRLDPFRTNDRQIGLFGAAIVWVKPWGISNYAACMDIAVAGKPVAIRTRDGGPIRLEAVATNVLFPIQADYMESEFGMGVWTRTNGAILYHAAGAVAYVTPTIP